MAWSSVAGNDGGGFTAWRLAAGTKKPAPVKARDFLKNAGGVTCVE
jgi:hypothetical protein